VVGDPYARACRCLIGPDVGGVDADGGGFADGLGADGEGCDDECAAVIPSRQPSPFQLHPALAGSGGGEQPCTPPPHGPCRDGLLEVEQGRIHVAGGAVVPNALSESRLGCEEVGVVHALHAFDSSSSSSIEWTTGIDSERARSTSQSAPGEK